MTDLILNTERLDGIQNPERRVGLHDALKRLLVFGILTYPNPCHCEEHAWHPHALNASHTRFVPVAGPRATRAIGSD